jgi:hypothetical protein
LLWHQPRGRRCRHCFQGKSDAIDFCSVISLVDDDVGGVFKVRAMP